MSLSLEEAIARVWPGEVGAGATLLKGGITNRNYRVDVHGRAYALRLGGENTELLGIDRIHEHAAARSAAQSGIGPEIIYCDAAENCMVTSFVAGRELLPAEMRRPENIRRVAAVLRRVHEMKPLAGRFSPFRTVEEYAEVARRNRISLPAAFERLIEWMREIELGLARQPLELCPCHNDLLNGNFLDDGEIRILDWEYAGMGDRFFDLANFAANHDFNEEQDVVLLESYFGSFSPQRLARLGVMKYASDFREAMWGLVQSGISTLELDFAGYARTHFERLSKQQSGLKRRLVEVSR